MQYSVVLRGSAAEIVMSPIEDPPSPQSPLIASKTKSREMTRRAAVRPYLLLNGHGLVLISLASIYLLTD